MKTIVLELLKVSSSKQLRFRQQQYGFQGANYFALEWGDQVYWRVDWLMLRSGQLPVQTTSCTIVHEAEPPIYVSDHYPVVAELLIGT